MKAIRYATAEIDRMTGTSFKTNNISTSAYEYHDGKNLGELQVYFVRNKPVISVSEFSTTTNDKTIGPANSTYNALTDNDHYVLDKETGRFSILDPQKDPSVGTFRARFAYVWGRSTVPSDIRRLTVLVTVRDLAGTVGGREVIGGREKNIDFSLLDRQIESGVKRYRRKVSNV